MSAVAVALAGIVWLVLHEAPSTGPAAPKSLPHAMDESPAGPVVLVVSGDTAGWIVPCGCTSNQSGGLLRRGTFVSQQRQAGPVIVADAGGAADGASPYQRLKFEAIISGELAMGIAAHNIGESEAMLGITYLRDLARERHVPFLSANLRDSGGQNIFEPLRIIESGGLRVALVGVLTAPKTRGTARDWRVDDPREAVLTTLAAHRGKFDRAVVLAYLAENELRELAAALPEVDAVIGGPTGQSLAPERIGPAVLASATNKGKFLVSLSLPPTTKVPPAAEIVEMSTAFADDPAQLDNVQLFRRALAQRDFDAVETGLAPPGTFAPEMRVAGTVVCQECHADASAIWRDSNHSHAWETLVADEAHVDPMCQKCHTTGFGLPGGFQSRSKSAALVSVGCESCHGPAKAHADTPAKRTPFVAREQCTRCHDHENSPEFEFASYWSQIAHHGD
ncbi:MAG TPA: multiheme c-type cytochrome [Planctomycetaceae bacterium]|nr:multiheme c-type cytochrome [Planctomycetaceae bacterium]